jgi:hypothetical protein
MRILFITVFMMGALSLFAQDTTHKREVKVTSSFKPTLKQAAKINLNASPADVDTSRPRLKYDIPNQNLLFAYQPGSLKPLALSIDSINRWDNHNYVKVGYGSLNTPYFETGLSLGNGNSAGLNAYGQHVSSKGKIKYQEFSNTSVDLSGFVHASKNIELTGRFGAKEEKYKRYGYYPETLVIPVDSLRVRYQTMRSRLAMRNINRNEVGISFAPEVNVDIFTDINDNRETTGYFNVPLKKTFESGRFEAEVAADGGLTTYSVFGKENRKTNYFSISPSLFLKTSNLSIQAGIKPTWDNGAFKIFPNAMVELSSTDKSLALITGWIGHMKMNTYESHAGYNPWINPPADVNNSRVEEIYAGLKGALGGHFNYMAKAGVNKFTNLPLYINDTVHGNSFNVLYEPEAKAFNVHGEMAYTLGEKFSFKSGLTVNKYTGLSVYDKPWGLPQLEFTTNVRVQVMKDLYAKADVYAFDAPWAQTRYGKETLPGAFDLSAGLEFAVVKNVKLWAQFNNILNNPYERWKQYPVYGFNFLGGVVFSLAQSNKSVSTAH